MRFGRCRPLTAVQQLVSLQHNPISAGQGRVRLGQLLWDFVTRPTPLSRVYTLQIVYPQGRAPRVVVREPALREEGDAIAMVDDAARKSHWSQPTPSKLG